MKLSYVLANPLFINNEVDPGVTYIYYLQIMMFHLDERKSIISIASFTNLWHTSAPKRRDFLASETFQPGDGWTRPYALPLRGRFSGHRRDSECCSFPGKHLACTSVFWDCTECLIKSNYAAVFSEFSEIPCKPTCAADGKLNVFNADINDSTIESTQSTGAFYWKKPL